MIISREYTVTAKTSLENKQTDTLNCPNGTITRVRFISAPGINYEVYARIIHFEDSIVPDETGEWLALAGVSQEYVLNWDKWNKVYQLSVELCSPDARFNHDIQLEMEIEEGYTLKQLFNVLVRGTNR